MIGVNVKNMVMFVEDLCITSAVEKDTIITCIWNPEFGNSSNDFIVLESEN